MKLVPAFVTEAYDTENFSVRFSPDGTFMAASTSHGQVSIYNVRTRKEGYRLNTHGKHPMKQICWRPEQEDAPLRTRGVLVGTSTDGKLQQWHVTSGQCLMEMGSGDCEQQFLCVDYSPDASKVAVGSFGEVLLYDETARKQVESLKGGDSMTTAGHASRVQAVRFSPVLSEPSILVSGGWDNSVQYWDLRVGHAVRAIFGPHLCGDALDISADGRVLLTGSWREEEPLELWDLAMARRLQAIPWRAEGVPDPACLLYSARFAGKRVNGAQLLTAGGSFAGGSGEAKVMELRGNLMGGSVVCRCLCTLINFVCLSADFTATGDLVALAGCDGRVRVMHVATDTSESRDDCLNCVDGEV
mmetsp:Transcript_100408/g.199249  ORF Transcript_100408/g.199249 Transcript_100408/m.199249 type:complete len:358 (-) Transcript_100408:114-1187(-)|eukprot:CAMPEP_0172709970 /NCGR_PEP_ID=MMETSP1074-20121228/55376_1 /TAXON_ID=2916 /ORGANISM="Ceratium fusus, Strain PA161109" /LENGTH=357 /DNA_ID=CAMNT_0013533297 /DNA_START=49 /DNA_END=1122 /DNA_ORIENTATION=-